MKKENQIKLFKLIKEMSYEQRNLDEVFGETEYLYFKVDKLVDLMLSEIGIPSDDRGLLREPFYQVIYDYALDYSDLTATQVVNKISNLKEEYDFVKSQKKC